MSDESYCPRCGMKFASEAEARKHAYNAPQSCAPERRPIPVPKFKVDEELGQGPTKPIER